ncbi:MAG: L,D-transpeptidase [Sphingomonadaceae bacterium]|nr:MAG: L,D-transpeptidase [Sphingomonadaceae bacterium]
MRSLVLALSLALAWSYPSLGQEQPPSSPSQLAWRPAQTENLLHWVLKADEEAIELPDGIEVDLRAALASPDRQRLDMAANTAALALLRAYHGKCCGPSLPRNWHISQTVSDADLRAQLAAALAQNRLDPMLRASRPNHPHYRALTTAFASEPDKARGRLLALNLARWRSLPLPRTGRYLIVNVAAQELTMWDGQTQVDSWRVIVGKTSSPTPVFSVEVTGVVINPWWIIPSSIAAEGIGAFVRRSPAAARAKGYFYSSRRYRQMPGDNNALGRMKLVMPNRFTVFLHDTSNRKLFEQDERRLSHGCVRVDRALQFAATLLSGSGWEQAEVDAVVAAEKTRTLPLSRPVPLYIAYFTAEPTSDGTVRFLPDIYRRDGVAALKLPAPRKD